MLECNQTSNRREESQRGSEQRLSAFPSLKSGNSRTKNVFIIRHFSGSEVELDFNGCLTAQRHLPAPVVERFLQQLLRFLALRASLLALNVFWNKNPPEASNTRDLFILQPAAAFCSQPSLCRFKLLCHNKSERAWWFNERSFSLLRRELWDMQSVPGHRPRPLITQEMRPKRRRLMSGPLHKHFVEDYVSHHAC